MSNSKEVSIVDFDKEKFKKSIIFILNHRVPTEKSSMPNIQFPPHVSVPSQCDVYDENTKRRRIARYVPGEMSIWRDEQSKDSDIPKKLYTIDFTNGFLHVGKSETQLLDFLRVSEFNGSNIKRTSNDRPLFWEVKMQEGASNLIQIERKKDEAKNWCISPSTQVDELIAYAKVLNIDCDRSIDEIRWDLKVNAESNPDKFMAGLKAANTKRKYTVITAIEKGILVKNIQANTMTWADGKVISLAPIGRDPLDHLVDLTQSDSKGENLYATLCEMIKEIPTTKAAAQDKNENHGINTDLDENETLVEAALKEGSITKAGAWYYFGEDKKWIGRKIFEEMKKNPKLVDEIKSSLKVPA
jgi:hypothetical protein